MSLFYIPSVDEFYVADVGNDWRQLGCDEIRPGDDDEDEHVKAEEVVEEVEVEEEDKERQLCARD